MERETGTVEQVLPGGWARVMVTRGSACSRCSQTSRCCITAGPDRMSVRARNQAGARAGDTVSLRVRSGALVQGAAVMYVLPLVGLLAGALAGTSLQGVIGLGETAAAVLLGFAGLLITIPVSSFLSRKMSAKGDLTPVVERIVRGQGR